MNIITTGDFFIVAVISVTAIISCANERKGSDPLIPQDTTTILPFSKDTIEKIPVLEPVIVAVADTLSRPAIIRPDSIVAFAKTLTGVPYLYASTDPAKGFDCSGFITYVFRHFSMSVPRSSVDFTNYGKTIMEQDARPGDLILFTGTDSTIRIAGHMGIVESVKNDTLRFIHSSSGKGKGVVISPLGNYYRGRFVKVIRVFPDEMFR